MGEKVGVVKVVDGKYFVESSFSPLKGDAFKILREGKEVGGAFFDKLVKRGFVVASKARLKNGDGVFVTTDHAVNERILSAEKLGELRIKLSFEEGGYAVAEGNGIVVRLETPIDSAIGRPLTEEEVKTCFSKTDGLPVRVVFDEIQILGNCFLPKSVLNGFRRNFYERLLEKISGRRSDYDYVEEEEDFPCGENSKTAVISSDFEGLETDIAVYKPQDYANEIPKSYLNGRFEKYLYYPAFATERDIDRLLEWIKMGNIDGIYAENYGGIQFALSHRLKIFAGTGLNLINRLSVIEFLKTEGATYYAISKETDAEEIARLKSEKAFVLAYGDVKLMDLCYCPFGKSCKQCDRKNLYILTDENGREFPVARYVAADGQCRFEVYNCAKLIVSPKGVGQLIDCTLSENKKEILSAKGEETLQKNIFETYTSGHAKRKVL